jgi:Ca2+-binding EF-hand superfamily protein
VKKFREIDSNNNGTIEKQELISLAEWMLKSGAMKSTYQLSVVDIDLTKAKILEHFGSTAELGITLNEFAVFQEEVLVLSSFYILCTYFICNITRSLL